MSFPINVEGVAYPTSADVENHIRDLETIVWNPHAYHASEIVGAARLIPILRGTLDDAC